MNEILKKRIEDFASEYAERMYKNSTDGERKAAEHDVIKGAEFILCRHAFMDGAQWRISSVWHDAEEEEEPKQNAWFIAQMVLHGEDDEIFFDTFILRPNEYDNWQNWREGFNIKRWAYIDDLLPERKEE